MEKLTLWDRDKLAVWAEWNESGELVLSGQDLRGGEYEYFLTVKQAALPKLTEALGCDREGLLAALETNAEKIITQGESRWLKSLGVDATFHSF